LADDVRRLKEEFRSRKIKWKVFTQFLYVLFRWPMMLLVERDQDFGVGCTDSSARAVGGVDRAERNPDVVENRDQLVFRNLLAQNFFHLVAQPCGLLYARAGAGAHVKAKDSSIDAGKEVLSQEEDDPE